MKREEKFAVGLIEKGFFQKKKEKEKNKLTVIRGGKGEG